MSGQGTTTVNFGSFPGTMDASVAVAQTGIQSTSLVEAWIFPVATADHTADEHIVDPPFVVAGAVSAGVGFTIYAIYQNDKTDGVDGFNYASQGSPGAYNPKSAPTAGNEICYGLWTVAWVWN